MSDDGKCDLCEKPASFVTVVGEGIGERAVRHCEACDPKALDTTWLHDFLEMLLPKTADRVGCSGRLTAAASREMVANNSPGKELA